VPALGSKLAQGLHSKQVLELVPEQHSMALVLEQVLNSMVLVLEQEQVLHSKPVQVLALGNKLAQVLELGSKRVQVLALGSKLAQVLGSKALELDSIEPYACNTCQKVQLLLGSSKLRNKRSSLQGKGICSSRSPKCLETKKGCDCRNVENLLGRLGSVN